MRRSDRPGRWAPLAPLLAAACASSTYAGGAPDGTLLAFQPRPADLRVADRTGADPSVFGGLWTFEMPPRAQWHARHEFAPDTEWLERVRRATARIGEYCSGAVVSPAGMILTTQSCVRECIAATTVLGGDDVLSGVNARSAGDERVCPGLFADVLVDVDDVTKTVETVVLRAPPESRGRAREAAIARIEQECGAEPGRVCQVTRLWNGARLHLYTYRRFTTVKLAFATELQVATGGGGADHLAWPRHALDFAVLRAYERDGREPAPTPAHFTLRTTRPDEGETLFVTGSPINSMRLATTAQLAYERDVRLPQNLRVLESVVAILNDVADDPAVRQAVRDDLYNVRGSLDQVRLQYQALHDTLIVGARIGWEREVQRVIATSAELQASYGDLWDRLAELQFRKSRIGPRLNASNVQLIGAPHLIYGIDLGRYVRARALPEAERPRELRGAAGQRLEAWLLDESYIDARTAERFLVVYLDVVSRWLPADDPLRSGLVHPGESIDAAAARLAADSRLLDPQWRRKVIEEGPKALDASDDPLLRHALRMDSTNRALQAEWQMVLDEEAVQRRRLGEATLIAFGESLAPDATFSPRIADGVARGYRRGYDLLPMHTTFYGLFERDRTFPDRPTWTLPASFESRRRNVELATPLNFVVTADAFGYGSAVIDRAGSLTGLVIGTNAAHVAGRFAFRENDGRAVAVHAAAIVEALSSIYRAERLTRALKIEKGSE